jgi:hypothetical protein
MEKVTITITPTGYKVHAEGFVGDTCTKQETDLERFMQATAGITVKTKDQKRKLESMYATAPGHQVKY